MIVFISYAKEDSEKVSRIHADLKASGYQPWMDVHDIAPGQDWKFALQRAISTCDAAIICLSTKSVSKTGYVQVEVKEFLEQRKRRPEGSIYLIPVRLEPCQIPSELAEVHYADLFEQGGWEKVIASLGEAKRERRALQEQGEIRGDFTIRTRVLEERWEGLPGYTARLSYPDLTGEDATACDELNTVFRAKRLSTLQWLRANRAQQDREFWHDRGETAMFEGITDYRITFVSAAALSVVFTNYKYEGGAHGMTLFSSDNFQLGPVSRLPLDAFFKSDVDYRAFLGALAREGIKRQAWEHSLSEEHRFFGDLFSGEMERDWLAQGTTFKDNEMPEFTFSNSGLTLYFPPYQVACYAAGTWEITLPYYDLRDILRPDGPHNLFIARPEER
jgi:TIR domain/Protein of unknown function (DUF3298)/Deacetylase PdaC